MKLNYQAFRQALLEENYEDAFHILFRMIDNLDPEAIRADRKWTKFVRHRVNNKSIQALEKEFYELPRTKKKEIQDKFNLLNGELK